MSFVNVNWTEDQVVYTLQAVLNKLLSGDESLTIKQDGYEQNCYTVTNNSTVYLYFRKNWIHMILDNNASGAYSPSALPWKDKVIKSNLKQIINFLSNRVSLERAREEAEKNRVANETATRALFNALPEALTVEFEKHILESKDGEENEKDT